MEEGSRWRLSRTGEDIFQMMSSGMFLLRWITRNAQKRGCCMSFTMYCGWGGRVGWKGGVAYRRAHGRVERKVLDGLEVEAVDLVLG